MKQTPNLKRARGRPSGRNRPSTNRGSSSSDIQPTDGRTRGQLQQSLDKYLNLARDAQSAGDRIAAEGFYQHAEHFYRLLSVCGMIQPPPSSGATQPVEKEKTVKKEPDQGNHQENLSLEETSFFEVSEPTLL